MSRLSRYQDDVLLDLVGLLYDASGDVEKWTVFAEAASQVFRSTIAHLLSYNPHQRAVLSFNIFYGVTQNKIDDFVNFFVSRPDVPLDELDLRNAFIRLRPGQVCSCYMLPDRAALERSELFQTLLHPNGADYVLGVHILHEFPCYTAFAVMRGANQGPYDAEDVAAMNKLMPHFQRAIKLQKQLLEIDLHRRTALDALNLLPTGIVITDAAAHVLFANSAAERLNREAGGISLQGGRIGADNHSQTTEVRAKLHHAVLSAEAGRLVAGWSIALKRLPPRRPLLLTISPLWGNHLKTSLGFLDRPYGILFINDPDSVQETQVELFQRLYGLTTSEALILKHLCDGLKPQDIADHLHVSIKTVRTHLSNLFAKTSTSRQPELMRLALASQPQAAF